MLTGQIAPARKALVVDDSTTLQRLMDFALSRLGFDVEFADNGEDAISLSQSGRYDIIFLDVMLPGRIDGYQVCKVIKAGKNTRTIPVVMLTSKDSAFDKVRGLMAGTDVYLTKPLDTSKLSAAINKYLSGGHPAKLRA